MLRLIKLVTAIKYSVQYLDEFIKIRIHQVLGVKF